MDPMPGTSISFMFEIRIIKIKLFLSFFGAVPYRSFHKPI